MFTEIPAESFFLISVPDPDPDPVGSVSFGRIRIKMKLIRNTVLNIHFQCVFNTPFFMKNKINNYQMFLNILNKILLLINNLYIYYISIAIQRK